MPSVKFPINIDLESTDGDVDRAKIVNGYAEVANAQEVKVYSRPAMNLAQGSFAAFGQGMANTPDGKLFVVSGGTTYFPVPGQTISASGTTTTAADNFIFRGLGNNIYGFAVSTNATVLRAAPPYNAFSSIGTHPAGVNLRGGQVYGGTMLLFGSSAQLYKSVNCTAWSTFDNSQPSNGLPYVYALNGTMFAYQDSIQNATLYAFSTDWGSTAWSTALITASNINQNRYAAGTFDNRLWALHGTGTDKGVVASTDGATWTHVNADPGWAQNSDGAHGNSFASLDGVMYAAMLPNGTNCVVWASADKGETWASVGTATNATSFSKARSMVEAGNQVHAFLAPSSTTFVHYLLSGDGTLQGLEGLGPLDVPAGGMVDVVATESGLLFVKSVTSAYTISSGALTKVSDAQYPTTTVRGAVYLNGRLYVMEPDGTIWNSAEDDFTSWAGTDFVTAEFEADAGITLAKQGEYVIALGQFTAEAFYDAGNPTGSPLDPVGSAVMLIGCAHANSVAQVETSLVWVAQQKGQGSTFHKGRFVAFMRGYGAYDRISTPDVERVLDADAFTEVYADILTIAGHVFYVLTLVDSDITLVYDFRSKLWYQWSLLTQGSAVSVSSITQTGGVATATATSHGFSDGDQVTIAGANQAGYNLTVNVNRVDANTFTYPVAAATVSPATGTITATGWTEGALDISASCYFDNSQLVQLRETGDVYVLDVTGTDDNGAPIDFRIRTRLWDAGTGREKFQNGLEVQGDKVSSTGLVRYWNEDFTTPTKYKRVDLSLRRPRSKRGGSFSRRAVEFRHTLSAKVGISALEADIELGEQ